MGSQEHFYLETNSTVVIPKENNSLEIYSSTQNPTKTQIFCASVCGLQHSKVVAKCTKMGGFYFFYYYYYYYYYLF
jgi:xanthine dehydrogenase/oxidase